MDNGDADWNPVIDLIERVTGDRDLLPSVVAGVSASVREVSVLPPADIAGHTRALLAAATRAIAARRGPTEAELSFVAELGVTRARQGVPIEAVLSAIHVAERAIWARAREVAAAEGIGDGLVLDARELYDDWAEAVRSRLIKAHREAQAGGEPGPDERDAAALRRLLHGGSAAALAAAEAGLPSGTPVWLLASRPATPVPESAHPRDGRRRRPPPEAPPLSAVLDGLRFTVTSRPPAALGPSTSAATTTGSAAGGRGRDAHGGGAADGVVGVVGPVGVENLAAARRLAVAALEAGEAAGAAGPVHAADVAVLIAVGDRSDLTSVLLERHRAAQAELGTSAEPVARAVCAWLEARRDVTAAAGHLFVHPNTVRNRVRRFTEATGIDPSDAFGAVNAWWLCRAWLAPG
ncbi:MAG: helix-turn-helix domain-containing protein [Actinomadura sp.]